MIDFLKNAKPKLRTFFLSLWSIMAISSIVFSVLFSIFFLFILIVPIGMFFTFKYLYDYSTKRINAHNDYYKKLSETNKDATFIKVDIVDLKNLNREGFMIVDGIPLFSRDVKIMEN